MIFQNLGVRFGEIHKINISMERLQKTIAAAGIASRRKAEQLILDGKVKVNGKVVTTLGFQVSPQDTVEVNGIAIKKEEKVYYLFHKPKHTVCTVKDDKGRETVLDYFRDVPERIFPIGRLDYETTGVLLLTNDGEVANKLMHPRYHIPKKYIVTIEGWITEKQMNQLREGVPLKDGMTLPAEVELIQQSKRSGKSIFAITIYEGKNREIRRMMEYLGFPVLRLERVQYGTITYGKLRQGEYRKLRSFEIKELLKACQ